MKMQFIITFFEGIVAFISPCHLPMLPVYLSYFAGGAKERNLKRTLQCAFGFVLGFSAMFVILGALIGFLGELLDKYETVVNIVTGAAVVLFGLNYIGVFNIHFQHKHTRETTKVTGFFSAVLFGIVFSISLAPCTGMFLGSALMLASQQGSLLLGIIMLLCFSAGMGLPFIVSAILIDQLKSAFDWIKRHYKVINLVSGLFLVVMGILMMTGVLHMLFE
jgi:cytochrome c-type biogenesis protein